MTVIVCPHCTEETEYLSVEEAAEVRGKAHGTIRNWIKVGLKHLRMTDKNRSILIEKSDLETYVPPIGATSRY